MDYIRVNINFIPSIRNALLNLVIGKKSRKILGAEGKLEKVHPGVSTQNLCPNIKI